MAALNKDEEYYINLALLDHYASQKELEKQFRDKLTIQDNDEEEIKLSDDEEEDVYLHQDIFKILNPFQKKIAKECLHKKNGGLSLPLGSGKTLLALFMAIYWTKDTGTSLIVASKSLIASWMNEIEKFMKGKVIYEVIHPSMMKKNALGQWKLKKDTQLVLTTPEVLSKAYKTNNVNKEFIEHKFVQNGHGALGNYINFYKRPEKPFLNHVIGNGVFHSTRWNCLIVDEAQMYTNIDTQKCQALGSLCAEHRWVLSGTLFDEPKDERILGYHIILDIPGMPRNLPDTKKFIKGNTISEFRGLREHLVIREKNEAFIPPKVNEHIITHTLSDEEATIYTLFRQILLEVKRRADIAKIYNDTENLKKFSVYKMVMVLYLRQALICPLIPIASIAIDASDIAKKSELSHIIMEEIGKIGINHWLDNTDSVKSSRIEETMRCIEKHKDEKILVFSCFKTFLDILQYYLDDGNRPILRMTSAMSLQKRGELINRFKETENGVLLMTYELGATGLNLQFASTVLLVDQWWNSARASQAIGRIFRFGQIADEINIYFFTANTGIEKIIFEKQDAKKKILAELMVGSKKSKIPRIKIDEVIKLIELNDNKQLLKKIDFY